jgi:hypothetical protein
MNVRAQLAIGLALVACALLAGYLLGRRPDVARERRIGELVEQTRHLEADRAASRAVADSALTRAANSDSAARAALARADRLLTRPPPLTVPPSPDHEDSLTTQVARLTAQVDTLTAALIDTRTALERQLEVGAGLRQAVASLTAQGQRDSLQIARLTTELRGRAPPAGASLTIGRGWTRAALLVAGGFVAGAVLTR